MTQTVPATAVLGPGATGLTIGLRVLNLDGTTYAAFSTTGVAETSTAGTYRKAGGVVAPLAGGYIVWGTAGTDYAEATVDSAAVNVTTVKDAALTESAAGRLAAALSKLLDVETPVLTAASVNQSGDAYARLGAPAGASVSADVAAVKAETAAIVDDTGASGVVVASGSKTGYSLAADQAVNATKIGGTTQTGRDLGASVLISSGTGTGQLDVTSGVIKANLAQILGTALTETAGQIAAAFKQFFNVASPTGTMKAITNVVTTTNLTNLPAAAATAAELAKVPKSDGTASWNATALAAINAEVDTALNTAIPGSPTADSINERIAAIDAYGTPPTVAAIRAEMDSNSTKLANLDATVSSRLATAGYTAPLDAAGVRTAVGLATANLDTQLAALPTDADVQTAAAAALTAYDPPTKAELDSAVAPLATAAALDAVDNYVDTEVAAIKAVTDKLDTALVLDGAVYQLTANALELAPTGGSAPSAATIASAVRTELATELGRINVPIDSRLAPATAGRTLAVDASGNAAANVTYWAGQATSHTDGTPDTNLKWINGVQLASTSSGGYLPAEIDAFSEGAIRTAIGLATANMDTQLAAVAKTGADGDTLETLSDQIDAVALEATAQAILEDTGTTLPALLTSTLASFVNTYSTDATTAGSITRRRGDSWTIVPAALGVLTGYTSLWLTIKRSHDDADSASVLHVKKNASGLLDGLLYLNGAASTSNLASITVTDALTGVISIAVDEAATKELAPGEYYYDIQTLISGNVSTPDSGTFTVTADVTRSVT